MTSSIYTVMLFCSRLLTLVCPDIWTRTPTTSPKEDIFHSSGQLQRPFCTGNTVPKVMCGVMEWSCMRYGHLDTNPLKTSLHNRSSQRVNTAV